MRFVIVTGMSGAGKSSVLKMLEDAGYFCVDNLPIPLLPKFSELVSGKEEATMPKVALGIDIRSGEGLATVNKVLDSYIHEFQVLEMKIKERYSDEVLSSIN